MPKPVTCYCAAYPFPHASGGGKCRGDNHLCVCSACKQPCDLVRRDFGHGDVEVWGAWTTHHDWRLVSECCEAAPLENKLGTPPYVD